MRDVLLGDLPPFCFNDETYFYVAIFFSLGVFFFHSALDFLHRPLLYFDALGLATFLVIGTGKALDFEAGFLVAVMMGVMTATAGGLVRDVLSNQVPLILQREVYATACVIGGVAFVFLDRVGIGRNGVAVVSALTVLLIRITAIHRNWSLPIAGGGRERF